MKHIGKFNLLEENVCKLKCKCHCHKEYCPDCGNICFLCSNTGIAGRSDICTPVKQDTEDKITYNQTKYRKPKIILSEYVGAVKDFIPTKKLLMSIIQARKDREEGKASPIFSSVEEMERYVKQDTEDSWEQRFRKRYRELWSKEHFHPETVNYWDGIEPELEQFIQSEIERVKEEYREANKQDVLKERKLALSQYKKELVKKIRKMKREAKKCGTVVCQGEVLALDQVIKEIKEG